METLTIRIYFEHKARAVGLTRWQQFWNNSLGHQLIRKGKEHDLKQVLLFNVSSGYLKHQSINWEEVSEYPSPKHPRCLEITDHKDKIEMFLTSIEAHLKGVSIIAVESQTIRQINN